MGIEEDLDRERPPSWVAENEGDQLIGIVRGYEENVPGQFGPETICILEDDQGEWKALWLYGAVLKQQFAKLKPKIGEVVGVRYLGKVQGQKGGNPYKNWKVAVEREDGSTAEPNWEQLAGNVAPDEEGVTPAPPPQPQAAPPVAPRPPTAQELLQRAGVPTGALERQALAQAAPPAPDMSGWQSEPQQVIQGPVTTERRPTPPEVPAQTLQPMVPPEEMPLEQMPVSDMQIRALGRLSEMLGVPAEDWSRYNRAEAAALITEYQRYIEENKQA